MLHAGIPKISISTYLIEKKKIKNSVITLPIRKLSTIKVDWKPHKIPGLHGKTSRT